MKTEVTLNGSPGNTYSLGFGKKLYLFEAGKPLRVPPAVALLAKKKTGRDGKTPLFEVADLPEVVSRAGSDSAKNPSPKKAPRKAGKKSGGKQAESGQESFGL
jgi:hypothetical protein